jgi:tRNA-Thr(GGU) m(6)t(6)A37 methyltransferase TsaA
MKQRGEEAIVYHPIGVIHSPHQAPKGTPIQPPASKGAVGRVEVYEPYTAGLADLEGFSHVILLYHFHLVTGYSLRVTPFMDGSPHGVFSTRAPVRPNRIGLSVVELTRREGGVLHVRNIDVVDGTPLLDVKPYVPGFDAPREARVGWLEDNITRLPDARDDERFLAAGASDGRDD